MRSRPATALLTLVLVISACGCSASDEDGAGSMGQHEAERRVIASARATLTATVGIGGSLNDLDSDGNPVTTLCSDISEPPPGTPVTSTFSYKIEGADLTAIDKYFVAFRRHLEAEGWSRLYGEPPFDLAYGKQGLALLLTWAPQTKLFALTAGTGCVKPD